MIKQLDMIIYIYRGTYFRLIIKEIKDKVIFAFTVI